MKFNEAQQNMQYSYFNGSLGVFISGIVWCIAGGVAIFSSNFHSMLALFFGGMFIHPLSILLAKALKRPGKHKATNPLGNLAIETTVILFVGLFLAFYVAKLKVEWFYPVMLLTIGVRYLMFNTLYGNKLYWILGASLMASGIGLILLEFSFVVGAFLGGIIEIAFSLIIFNQTIFSRQKAHLS